MKISTQLKAEFDDLHSRILLNGEKATAEEAGALRYFADTVNDTGLARRLEAAAGSAEDALKAQRTKEREDGEREEKAAAKAAKSKGK